MDIATAGTVHASTQGNTNKQMIDRTKDDVNSNSGIPPHVPTPFGIVTICTITHNMFTQISHNPYMVIYTSCWNHV